jgi:FkbM family methyltransferase
VIKNKLRILYYSNRIVRLLLALPVLVRHRAIEHRLKPAFDAMNRLKSIARGDIILHIEEFMGEFQFAPSSHLLARILVIGSYEPELAYVTGQHIDSKRDFIDVGANIGFYSVLACRRIPGRRVLAIEPSAAAHSRLLANLQRNNVRDQCIVFNGLAGAGNMDRELQVVEGMEEYSSVAALKHYAVQGHAARVELVKQSTIDSLVTSHNLTPGFIKIDVEGNEMEVLKGAVETLRVHRPALLCEVADDLLSQNGSSSRELFSFLEGLGYELSDPMLPGLRPGRRGHGDVLALPKQKSDAGGAR